MSLAQEAPLKSYTRRIAGCKNLNYWQRLKYLKLQSTERRADRYRILYVWKMMNGKVPNYGLEWSQSNRKMGRMIVVPRLKQGLDKIKTHMEDTLKF